MQIYKNVMSILNHVYTVAIYDGRDFFERRNNIYFVLLIPFCKSIIFTCFCKVVCQVSSKIKTHSYTNYSLYRHNFTWIFDIIRVCVFRVYLFRYIRRSLIICSNLKKFGCCIIFFLLSQILIKNSSFFNNFKIYI